MNAAPALSRSTPGRPERVGRVAPAGLGLGCPALGNRFRGVSDAAARATVDAAWDAGLRRFDTAPYDRLGLAERRSGDAWRDRPRVDNVLSTKAGRQPGNRADLPAVALRFALAHRAVVVRIRARQEPPIPAALWHALRHAGLTAAQAPLAAPA